MLELTSRRLAGSAYRTLGLSASATQAQIDQAARRLRIWPDPNSVPPTPWDLSWLGQVARSKNDIEQAMSRLNEPATRIEERLIWFHGTSPALWASADSAAMEKTFASLARATDPASLHDLALAKLQLGLLRDSAIIKTDQWDRIYQRLAALAESDDYLAWVLDVENSGDFDKRAQIDEIAAVVQSLPASLTSLFASKAETALEDDNATAAVRILGLLRGDKSGVGARCETRILDRIEDLATRRCQQIPEELDRRLLKEKEDFTQQRPHNQSVCREVATLFQDSVEPALAQLESIAGPQSDRLQRVRSAASRAMCDLAHAWTWSGRFIVAERTLHTALSLARGTPLESAITERLEEYQRRSLAEQQGVTFTGQRTRVVTTRKVVPARRRSIGSFRSYGGSSLGVGGGMLFAFIIALRFLAAMSSSYGGNRTSVTISPPSGVAPAYPTASPTSVNAPSNRPSPIPYPVYPPGRSAYPGQTSPQGNPYAPSQFRPQPNPYTATGIPPRPNPSPISPQANPYAAPAPARR